MTKENNMYVQLNKSDAANLIKAITEIKLSDLNKIIKREHFWKQKCS